MKENILGVVGGMGPLATDVLYRYIIDNTDAEKDQDHIDMLILSAASMPDRTEAIMNGDLTPIIEEFKKNLSILEYAGAKNCIIPCNTCHVILDEIQKLTDIHIIDMIALCANSIGMPGKKIGIMATDGTLKAGLYHKAIESEGMTPVTLPAECQKQVMHIIYDQVKAGKPADLSELEKLERKFRELDCEKVILGCTELSVICYENELSDIFVDPMYILARHVIPMAGGRLK